MRKTMMVLTTGLALAVVMPLTAQADDVMDRGEVTKVD